MMQCHGAWMLHCCHNAVTAIKQSSLLSVCCSSLTIVATIVILLLDVLLVILFGRVDVWKVFFFTSGQCSRIALKVGSVCDPATVCCCQLKIYLEQVVFHMCCWTVLLVENMRQIYHVAIPHTVVHKCVWYFHILCFWNFSYTTKKVRWLVKPVRLEAELFDTLDDLFAKFDNPLVHLAVNGIILKFRHWVSFGHCILEKHKYFHIVIHISFWHDMVHKWQKFILVVSHIL
jgi:hypothetical protein